MAFWSSQTLEDRIGDLIVPPPKESAVDCNAITLRKAYTFASGEINIL
jgi:hypothetical protein